MYISSATRPINHLDALPLLLDGILGGDDVTLIDEGGQGRALLDLAAGCLAGLRSRILWATELLPDSLGVPMPSSPSAGPSKASIPNDDLLTRGFQALTVLDQTCDRVVLLVSDAHALQHSILRYIQFVSRSGTHLQLVFCGTGEFFDLLSPAEFEWLRARLLAGLVVTLAAPVAKAQNIPSSPLSVPDGTPVQVERTALPPPGPRRPAVYSSMPSRVLWLGALALFGFGGAVWFALGVQNGKAGGSATVKQAAVVQSPTTPKPPAAAAPGTQAPGGTASHADSKANSATPATSAPHLPAIAGDVQGANLGSPSNIPLTPPSSAASGALATVLPPAKAGLPEAAPNDRRLPEPLPSPARSPDQRDVPTDPSRTAAVAVTQSPGTLQPPVISVPETQIPDDTASHAASEASSAAPNSQALRSPLITSDEGAEPGPPPSMPFTPPPTAASGALISKLPQTKAGAPESEPNVLRRPEPLPTPAHGLGWQAVPAAPSRTAAAAPGGRTRRPKDIKAQLAPLPADDRLLASQSASGSSEPPSGRSPQYIGSYATDANGVRMFHLEP